MSGKTARMLRRLARVAGVPQRQLKRSWVAMTAEERRRRAAALDRAWGKREDI